jgi:hypothetical protein
MPRLTTLERIALLQNVLISHLLMIMVLNLKSLTWMSYGLAPSLIMALPIIGTKLSFDEKS